MTDDLRPILAELKQCVIPKDTTFYLRPFVSDGHPADCPVVLLGYNAATQIPLDAISRDCYCQLLVDRARFESFYSEVRSTRKHAEGTKHPPKMSTTRKRLGLIRDALGPCRIVETNLNAWPARNVAALRRLPADQRELGKAVADWALQLLRPQIVVAYGAEFDLLVDLRSVRFALESTPTRKDDRLEFYPKAQWMGSSCRVAWIRLHLAARGVRDDSFRKLGRRIAAWKVCDPRAPY